MSDILKVTTKPGAQGPIGGLQNNPQNQVNQQNVIDPTRVVKPNSKDINNSWQENQFSPYFESNYDKFMQMLRPLPDMTQIYQKLFFADQGFAVSAGINENYAQEVSQFMELIKMNDTQLFEYIKEQLDGAVKYTGPFFDALRELISGQGDADVVNAIYNMLRKYDSMTSGGHIFKELVTNLNTIANYMPKNFRDEILSIMTKLVAEHPNGSNASNISVLKGEILPLLSRYISYVKDFGTLRDLINMFVYNLARYESGSAESFLQSYNTMLSYDKVRSKFIKAGLEDPGQFLLKQQSGADTQTVSAKLVDIITKGLKGEAGIHNKVHFENILKSMLLNESVYMPLLHIMIPANIDGKLLFSEIWVDPEDEDESNRDGKKSVKLLIKFDIKDAGYFEMIISAKEKILEMQLFYPDSFAPLENEIRDGIKNIIEQNNLHMNSFRTEALVKPKQITEVFTKINERKNTVNAIV